MSARKPSHPGTATKHLAQETPPSGAASDSRSPPPAPKRARPQPPRDASPEPMEGEAQEEFILRRATFNLARAQLRTQRIERALDKANMTVNYHMLIIEALSHTEHGLPTPDNTPDPL